MSGLVNTYGSKTGLCGREYAWRIGMASSGNVADNGTIFMNRTNGNGAFLRNVSWASDKIKIPVTGWYDLSFQVESTANAVNIIIYIMILQMIKDWSPIEKMSIKQNLILLVFQHNNTLQLVLK